MSSIYFGSYTGSTSSIPDASTTVEGVVEFATDAEAINGTSTKLVISPHHLNLTKEHVFTETITKNLGNIDLSSTTESLSVGVYTITIDSNTTFVLPTPVDNKYNQIKVIIKLDSEVAIDWGTTVFFNNTIPDVSTTGTYHAYWDYNPLTSQWVCGVMKEG